MKSRYFHFLDYSSRKICTISQSNEFRFRHNKKAFNLEIDRVYGTSRNYCLSSLYIVHDNYYDQMTLGVAMTIKRPEVAETERLCSLKLPGSITRISQNWHSARKNSISDESVLRLYPNIVFLKLI
jgi:hypothetical protein